MVLIFRSARAGETDTRVKKPKGEMATCTKEKSRTGKAARNDGHEFDREWLV